jgi:hypothetical protein
MNSAIAVPALQVLSLNSFILQMTGPGRGRGRPPQAPMSRQNNEDGGTRRTPSRGRAGGTRRRRSPSVERQVQRRRESSNDDVHCPGAVITRAQARNLMAAIRRAVGAYRPPIIRRHYDCDCNTDSYARSGSFCGAPFPGPWTGRTLRIHYHEFSDAAERVDALFAAMSDEEENPEGELYVLSADTYDPYSARSFDLLDSATS